MDRIYCNIKTHKAKIYSTRANVELVRFKRLIVLVTRIPFSEINRLFPRFSITRAKLVQMTKVKVYLLQSKVRTMEIS